MSFGSGFGSGGFGANNNNNAGGFGFGASTNNTGFGGSTNTFGQNNQTGGSSLFGNNNSNTGGGFGFGANNNAAPAATPTGFGAPKPAFGGANNTSAAGGMFGGGATSTAGNTGFGGGFGNTANAGTGFGGANNAGSNLFGQNKPATGFGASTGSSLFGGGAAAATPSATTGFGGNAANTTGFGGANTSSTFGASSQPTNQGTAVTPFSPFIEKDNTSTVSSHYQSISFMQPYQNFSYEELRLADYAAGRKTGNNNGQAGAFGQSTGFGGFGGNTSNAPATGFGATANNNNAGGMFGAQTNNNAATGFGANNQAANTGFGGGGMFGGQQQQKPAATGGLFGGGAASSGTTGGGLFGTANNTAANPSTGFGFGANNNNNQAQGATGTGMFGGAAASNTQNKPAFGGGFGASNPGGTTGFGGATTGFGASANNNAGGTGLFGGGAAAAAAPAPNSNPFGTNQQNNTTNNAGGAGLFGGGGGFGANNQQNQQQTQTGAGNLFGGGGAAAGGFGANANNQPKPNPFGTASTGATNGGLFGAQQPQQQNNTGGMFGGATNNNQTQSGGLFGAAKPATSLFGGGATNTANNTGGGGLFGGLGNNQNQQNNTTNAFSQSGTQQQKPGGLFGGGFNSTTTPNANGTSMFGGGQNQQQNQATSSLFGATQTQGQASTNPFANSQPSVAATLLTNPYGNEQLFTNLGNPTPSVGPLATPLSGAQKPAKRPAALPQFKINPSASLRLMTPQKRNNAYGFSYTTYGTPGSAQSFTSNGLGSSLLQSGGLSRSLGKSFSTSNLRNGLTNGDSVLAPGAFTPNSRSYTGGSIRRLKIDRNLKHDLFGDIAVADQPPAKRVSFDSQDRGRSSTNGTTAESTPNDTLVRTETDGPEPTPEELGLLRAGRSSTTNGNTTNGTTPSPEQTRNGELDSVPEDGPAPAAAPSKPVSNRDLPKSQADQKPGAYYMTPPLEELRKMSREQLKRVSGLTVGRAGVGKIEFDEVDLTGVPIDDIIGGIVRLKVRAATVYESGVTTPPMGRGLNVPSTITLENSWPRSQGGRLPVHERKGERFDKHIERLRRVGDTEFIDYNPQTGSWVFRVQHFTTYGLDDDDEDEDGTEHGSSSMVSSQDPTPKGNNPAVREMSQDSAEEASVTTSDYDESESNPDDTFDFKKGPSKIMPGSFGAQPIQKDDEMADDNDDQDQEEDSSFLEQRGTSMLDDPFGFIGSNGNAPPVQAVDIPMEEEYEESEQDLADSYSRAGAVAPTPYNDFGVSFGGSLMPKSILKASTMFNGTPKKDLTLAGDWAEQLQRTASPRKQDRQALRERQSVMGAPLIDNAPLTASVAGKAFSTTLDIMNSLWAPSASVTPNAMKGSTVGGKGFEWPYQKRSTSDDAFANMNENDQNFHTSVRPSWTTDGTMVYSIAGNAPQVSGNMIGSKKAIVSESKDIRFAKFSSPEDTLTPSLQLQLQRTPILPDASVQSSSDVSLAALAQSITQSTTPEARHECAVWKLASILFDPIEDSCADFFKGIPTDLIPEFESRVRRDALSTFWADLVREDAAQHAKDAATPEEKAVAFLSGNDIEDACATLIEGRNFRLATIVAQLPGDDKSREMMVKQIESWRSQNVLSEIPESVRALYELLAGNVCVSEGKTGATEDRASTFGISTRFGLDWRRSFGLRLWFTGSEESLVDAVHAYTEDVVSGKENVRPVPYFTEQTLSPSWNDVDSQTREDTLYGLLKLYSRKPSSDASEVRSLVTSLLSPTSVSGSPLNARFAWQLATLLRNKDVLTPTDLSNSTLDDLTVSLSSQLETATEFPVAVNVLLHLTTAPTREAQIRDLLYRRASALYDPSNPDSLPTILTSSFHLPEAWLWHARALHARSVLADHSAEVTYLLRASDTTQAHVVLCRTVGPTSIIERSYDTLRELLGAFHDLPSGVSIEGWRTGGEVYFDFIHLLDLISRDDDVSRINRKEILSRLTVALPGVLEGRVGKVGLEERVAVGEMAGVVRAEVEKLGREERGVDRGVLERLPVAGVAFAKQGDHMSRAYYRAIVA